jgi:hypothetical protein
MQRFSAHSQRPRHTHPPVSLGFPCFAGPETSFLFFKARRYALDCSNPQPTNAPLTTTAPARIWSNQPLRAKESNGYLTDKYPIIVRQYHYPDGQEVDCVSNLCRITSTMPSLSVPVVPVCALLSVWPRLDSRLLVSPSCSPQEVTLSLLRVVSTLPLESRFPPGRNLANRV